MSGAIRKLKFSCTPTQVRRQVSTERRRRVCGFADTDVAQEALLSLSCVRRKATAQSSVAYAILQSKTLRPLGPARAARHLVVQ